MNKISTEKAIEVLYTVRDYYASLTVGYPKGEDCKGIEDVTCSEIANSCLMAIKVLEQEPKTGYWIQTQEKDDAEPFILWKCSCCHKEFRSVVHKVSNYCPNCGIKMVEPQENEDKE